MQQALRFSRQQCDYAHVLWQDMLAAYGDKHSPVYWRQRAQRRAYQGAIVHHLLQACHSLATAVLKQLADTQVQQTTDLSLFAILTLLQQQAYLSAPAKLVQAALKDGHMAQLQTAQHVFNAAGTATGARAVDQEGDVNLLASDSLEDPDLWPVGQWLRAQQTLLETVQAELLEC